jgi:predicted lactoylglutathione lyase
MFVNLPVRDLERSMEFFSMLGFEFDPRYCDQSAGCMVISAQASVMLLSEPFFQTFTPKQICDTATAIEGLFALSCASRAEVDELVERAVAAGGAPAAATVDRGFLYGGSFYDLDGHHWEVVWMDPGALR